MKSIYLIASLLICASSPLSSTTSNSILYSLDITDKLGSGDTQETVFVLQNNTVLATLRVYEQYPEDVKTISFVSPGPHAIRFSSSTTTKGKYQVDGSGKVDVQFTNQNRLRYQLMATYQNGRNTLSLGQLD